MRTELDLRASMDDLAATAPTGAEVWSRFQAPQRPPRHRVALPALVAAVTIMVIAVVASVVHGRADDRSAAPADVGTGPSVAYPCAVGAHLEVTGIAMGPVDGLADTTRAETSCSGYSNRELDDPHGLGVGSVYVYRAGVFDTRLLQHATKVSGAGIDGYALTLDPSDPRVVRMVDPQNYPSNTAAVSICPVTIGIPGRKPTPVSTSARAASSICPAIAAVAWRYAPNRWGLVTASSIAAAASFYGPNRTAKLLEIAAATDTEHPTPIRVPFQNHSLPAGIRIVNVYSFTNADGRLSTATAGFGVTGRSGCPAGLACKQVGEVSLVPQSKKLTMSGTPVTVNGRTAYLLDQGANYPEIVLTLWTGTWFVTVGQSSDQPVPDRSLIDLARGLRYATSVGDRSTWFNVDDAFG